MNNVVDFRVESQHRRPILAFQGGAQILFFTGVRYSREDQDEARPFGTAFADLHTSEPARSIPSEATLDLAAH